MQADIVQILKEKITKAGIWSKKISLARNEYLKVKGSTDTNLYYIEQGSLRAYIEDEDDEKIIRLGYSKNFVAALDSFISEAPSDLYVQAIKKCELYVLPKKAFMEFIHNDVSLTSLWNEILGLLIYQSLEREKDILISSPRARYDRVFKRSPHLFQEIPNKYIASYLRMTPETLSRIKKS
ncbi:MAG: CRP-like cAMP-binding protein [Limisphaerales bacterium]|jgi:CRP-like cAMP-binding protein